MGWEKYPNKSLSGQMATLSEREFTIAVIVALLIVAISLVIVYWLSKKYPSKKPKVDPIYKGITNWLFLLLGYGIIVLLGIRTQEDTQSDVRWLIGALIVLILFYAIVSYFVNKPIPSFKLWKEYVLPDVKQQWNAKPYVGNGYFSGLILSMVIGNKQVITNIAEGNEVIPEKIEVFYGQAYLSNVFPFLCVRNKYTGERLLLAKPPILTTALLHKFLSEELVSSFAPVLSQYDTETEGLQQPQRQVEVRR